MTERLTFRSEDGLSIEAELDAPPNAKAGLVLCHPHPQMDGTMNAPLLLALRDELTSRRWIVLRFNFRGVGASEGESSLGGAELAETRAAIAVLRRRDAELPLAIAGWSFGGAVAVRAAAEDDSLVGCVGIAPAVRAEPDVTDGLPPADELDLGVPLLFVCGAQDEVVDPEDCRAWSEAIEHADLVEVEAANHFFWGRYAKLATIVTDWLDGKLKA
ncbi:MAG: alpha/beta hydrolase [Actinomycetota bacterium]